MGHRAIGIHLGDDTLINGEHNHFVVNETTEFDSPTERNLVEHLAEHRFIVHGVEHGFIIVPGLFGRFTVYFRCGGHVETFFRTDKVVIVNARKDRVFGVAIFSDKIAAGGTVRLIADGQGDIRKSVLLLSLAHHINRLIGREDHSHPAVILNLIECFSQSFGIGSGGEPELRNLQKIVLIFTVCFAGCFVGAHSKSVDFKLTVFLPVVKSLREQRQGGNQEHYKAFLPVKLFDHLFGNLHGREGLPGAAGHDEFSAICRLKAVEHSTDCFFLIGARPAWFHLFDFRRIFEISRPVNVGSRQILTGNQLHFGIADFVERMRGPHVCVISRDDDPFRKIVGVACS